MLIIWKVICDGDLDYQVYQNNEDSVGVLLTCNMIKLINFNFIRDIRVWVYIYKALYKIIT